MKQLHKVCGTLYLRFIVNVPSLTPTQGLLMGQFYHRSGIEPWAKKPEHTSLVERFNNTLRQRVSRLVRKTLSFSKSVENHIGAIWYFIHAYNKSLLLQDYRKRLPPAFFTMSKTIPVKLLTAGLRKGSIPVMVVRANLHKYVNRLTTSFSKRQCCRSVDIWDNSQGNGSKMLIPRLMGSLRLVVADK